MTVIWGLYIARVVTSLRFRRLRWDGASKRLSVFMRAPALRTLSSSTLRENRLTRSRGGRGEEKATTSAISASRVNRFFSQVQRPRCESAQDDSIGEL